MTRAAATKKPDPGPARTNPTPAVADTSTAMGFRSSCLALSALAALSTGCAGPSHPVFTMPSSDAHPAFRCRGHQHIVLRDVTSEARGDGRRVAGFCHLTVYDSRIYGTRFGVATTQFASVELVDSVVEGGRGWAFASGFSGVTTKGGVTVGPARVGQNGRLHSDDETAHVD